MPTNLYGPEDNFDLLTGHVPPALIRRFHEAKVSGAVSVPIWGTGKARREFLHADGMPRKLLDVSRLFKTGWRPRIGLEDGLASTYRWYVENQSAA